MDVGLLKFQSCKVYGMTKIVLSGGDYGGQEVDLPDGESEIIKIDNTVIASL